MFASRCVLITGASSGIGKALAEGLIGRGAHLALLARDAGKLEDIRRALAARAAPSQRILAFSCDVREPADVHRTLEEAAATVAPPHVLINSAGILREGPFRDLSLDTFREIMDTNFFGALHCIQAALPFLREQGGGHIVNVSSMGGMMGVFGYSAYCASKHALNGLSHVLRAELAPEGIHVHLVCPPETDTPMVEALNRYRSLENRTLVTTLPVLTAEAVARAILRGIERGRYEIVPGRASRAAVRLDRLLPSLGRTISDLRIRSIRRKASP